MSTASNDSLKIAYVVGGLPCGGVENWLLDLTTAMLAKGGYDPLVVNLSGTGVMAPLFEQAGVRVANVGGSKKALGTHRLDTLRKTRRLLRSEQPRIVHTAHFHGDYFGRLAAAGLGVPVVSHLRNIKREKKPFRRMANKVLSRFTSCYLSVSKAVAEVVAQDHNVACRPSLVLYNALNPAKLAAPPLDLRAEYGFDGPIVLGVGRLVVQKNFDLLLRAVALLRERIPVNAVVVGEGGQRPELEGLIRDLGLQGHAVLAGYRTDVGAFMAASDVLAMPSAFEGFGIAFLEAMTLGLPSVVSPHVPAIEVAPDACLVCDVTPEDLADKLYAILSDPIQHAKLAAEGKRVAADFTIDAYLGKLDAVYRGLLAGRELT